MDRAPGSVFCHSLYVKRVVAQDKNIHRPMGSRECPGCFFRGLEGENALEDKEQGSSRERHVDGYMRVSTKV